MVRLVGDPSGRRRALRRRPAAHRRRGDLALQPDRASSTSTGSRRRVCDTTSRCPSVHEWAAASTTSPSCSPTRRPTCSPSSTGAFMTPTVIRCPPARSSPSRSSSPTAIAGDGVAVFPRLVIDAGADSEVTVVERFVSADGAEDATRSSCPSCSSAPQQAARVRYLAINELGPHTWQIGHQQAIGERDSSTLLATVALGGDYARVRTEARLAGQGGIDPAGRALLRRRQADARLPHDPGPRRAAHDQRPAVQGRGAGPRGERVHRPDQDPQARQGHRPRSRRTAT